MIGPRLTARRSRARWRPSILELALLVLIIGAAVWGLRSLGEMMERHVIARREEAIGALFKLLNRNFSYGAIAPSLLRALEIRDLTIYSGEAPDQPVVSIRRLRLRYSLARLIASRDPIASLREVQLANSHVVVDLTRDQELVQVLRELGLVVGGTRGPAAGGVVVPPVTLAGANLGVTLRGLGFRLEVEDLFFRVQAGAELQLTARGRARAAPPAAALGALGAGQYLAADFRVSGSADDDLSRAALTVRLNELTSAQVRVAPQELQVSLLEDGWQVVRLEDRLPLELSFSHRPSSGRSELAVAATGLNLADVAEFAERHPLVRLLPGTTVSGTARWSHDPAAGMRYEAKLSGHVAAGADTPPAAATLTARGDGARVEVSRLTLETAEGGLEFAGDVVLDTLVPQGELVIRSLQVRPGEKLHAQASLTRGADGAMALRSERLALEDTVFRRFDVDLRPTTAAPLTYRYEVRAELQQEAANFIDGDGSVALGGPRRLELAASFDSINAGLLYRLVTPPATRRPWIADALEPLLMSGSMDSVTDFETAAVRAPVVRMRDAADPGNRLQFSLTANERGLRLEAAAAEWLGLEVRGQALVTRGDEAVDLAAELSIDDVPYEVRLTHTPGRGLTAAGSHELELAAEYDARALTVRGSAVRLPVPLPFAAAPLEATFAFRGRFAGPDDWSLRSDAVTLHRLPLPDRPDLQLEAGVQAESGVVELEPVLVRDRFSELRGRGSIVFTAGSDAVEAQLAVADADNGESYAATLELAGGRVDAAAELRGVPLPRLGQFPFSGNVHADVRASGPWQEVAWQAAVELRDGRLNDERVSLTGAVERSADGLAVRGLTFDLLSHRLRNGSAAYRPESGLLEFAADYSAEYFGDPVTARLELDSRDLQAGAGGGLRAALAAGVTGQLSVERVRVAGEPLDPWRLRLAAQRVTGEPAGAADPAADSAAAAGEDLLIRFEGGPRDAFAGSVSTGGSFSLQVQRGRYPVHGSASGTVSGGHVSAALEIEDADARTINELLGQLPVSFQAGTASGRARVAGPINDPDFWGEFRLAGGVVASPFSPRPVGPFRAAITLDEKRVALAGFAAEGPAALPVAVRGTASVERWVPAVFALELTSAGGVPINYQFGPLLFNGTASGTLSVTGDSGTVMVDGELQAGNAELSLVETEPASRQEQLLVELDVVTGRGVEFTWPVPQFPVLRLQLAPSESVRIGYDGQSRSVSVQGELTARGGDLFYFDRQFLLREGQIRFAGEEGPLDPRLVVRAETRERDAQGDPVRIILQADTTLSRFGPDTVRLSSDPPQSALVLDTLVRIGYDGQSRSVSVQGELTARGGDLFYFDRQFLLREGQIRFAGEEGPLDPRLVVRAETRERDAQGDPVRIILQADTTLSRFGPDTVRLSSDPPQSALVLDTLVRGPLAQGDRPNDGGAAGLSAAAFSGELMTQMALLRPVERALREALGVDMVSIRSQFVQTLVQDVFGASVSGGVVPGTGNPLDNTSLSFGKYLGSDLFLTMLLRLDAPDGQPGDDLPLLSDVELGLEWATPFFMLEWSFLPRNLNTLFVTDNTISLRWRWSY